MAEKALKAWICLSGSIYSFTHDLGDLLDELAALGAEVSRFAALAELTDFAGDLRYQPTDPEAEPLDRKDAIARVQALLEEVRPRRRKRGPSREKKAGTSPAREGSGPGLQR